MSLNRPSDRAPKSLNMSLGAACVLATMLLGLVILPSAVTAQSVTQDWSATLTQSGSAQLYGAMVAIDSADNIFVTGSVPRTTIITAKYDQAGQQIWQTEFDNPGTREVAAWLTVDPSGNAIVAGYVVAGASASPSGFVTLKYDTNGTLLWSDVIPNARGFTVRVATDSAGNIFVLGRAWVTNASGNTTDDFMTIKYAPDGTRLWTRTAGVDAYSVDTPNAMAVDAAGNVYVTGGTNASVLTVAYDPRGNLRWSRQELGAGGATDLALGPAGEVYVVSGTGLPGTLQSVYLVLKYDAAGTRLWANTYPGYYARRVGVDSHGDLIVTGYALPLPGSGYLDWLTHKITSAGSLAWTQRYDGYKSNDEYPYLLTMGPDDAVYITGQGGPSVPGTSYLSTVTVRYSSSGAEDWVAATTASVRGLGVARASNNTIAVVGQSPFVLFHYVQVAGPGGNTAPIASAFATPTQGSAPLIVAFSSAGSYDPDGTIASYAWNFGDFGSSTLPSPTHTYASPGTYVGTLVVTDDKGAKASTFVTVTVLASVPAPASSLTATPNRVFKGGVRLAWVDNATNETNFVVERCQGSTCANFTPLATLAANVVTYNDTSVARKTVYRYRVKGTNSAGSSAYSNIATATTP